MSTVAPGTLLAVPGVLPASQSADDGSVIFTTSSGAAVPVTVVDWKATGLVLQVPATTSPGSYELSVTGTTGTSSPVPIEVAAPTDGAQQITPLPGPGSLPLGIAEDAAGHLWTTDAVNNAIVEMSPDSSGGAATFTSYPLSIPDAGPMGVAVDQAGNVWVTDTNNGTVTELDVAQAKAAGGWRSRRHGDRRFRQRLGGQ